MSKGLVGVASFASKDVGDGFDDDLDIEEEAPVFYVPDIFLYAFFHHPEFGGFTSLACDLLPSCYSRFGIMANHVLIYQSSIFLRMLDHVRTWTYYAHITHENVDELWKFVDISLAHDVAPLGLTRVILCCLNLVGIGIDTHGAELETSKLIAIDTITLLSEEDWSWHRDLGDESDDGCYPPETGDEECERYNNIKQALGDAVEWIEQWLTTQGENWNVIHILYGHSTMHIVAHVRNRIEANEVILAVVHYLQYLS